MIVRPARSDESAALAEIGFRAWENAVTGWQEDVDALRDRARRAYAEFARDGWALIVVAEIGGRPAGWGARENGDHVISDLWVDPAHQKCGAGSALIGHMEHAIAAEGRPVAALETHVLNEPAIAFYKRRGYAIKWMSTRYSTSLERDIEKVGMEKVLFEQDDTEVAGDPDF